MRIKKGDNVMVMVGRDKGKTGKIVRVFPRENKIIIAGLNLKKSHQRPNKNRQKGQIVEKSLPFSASSVMILDPKSGRPTRVGRLLIDGQWRRVAKRSGAVLD